MTPACGVTRVGEVVTAAAAALAARTGGASVIPVNAL